MLSQKKEAKKLRFRHFRATTGTQQSSNSRACSHKFSTNEKHPYHCTQPTAAEHWSAMRTFILFITAGAVAAFVPQPRQLLKPATQMTTLAAPAPVAASRAVHKSNCRSASPTRLHHSLHAIDATSARRRGNTQVAHLDGAGGRAEKNLGDDRRRKSRREGAEPAAPRRQGRALRGSDRLLRVYLTMIT